MEKVERRKSEEWLDPATGARISGNEITWTAVRTTAAMRTGGDLYFIEAPRSGTKPHCHDFAEIIFVNAGSLLHRVNGERQPLAAGDIVFMRPDDVHAFLPDDVSRRAELVLLDFDLELLLSLSIYLENDAFLQQLTAPVLPPVFRFDPVAAGTFYARLLKLNSPVIPPPLWKAKLKILLGELYARFFIDEVNLLSGSQVPDWLEELCRQMRKERNFIGGVERMQQLACRTPGHLCKCFRKYLGKTPTDFVNELRLNHAARLLADTSHEIGAIVEELHFQSISHFYRLFRDYYGMPPAAYRKMHGGGHRV